MKKPSSRDKWLLFGARYVAPPPGLGPYAEAVQCAGGLWKVELNGAGRELVEAFFEKYPVPCKRLFRIRPRVHAVARYCNPRTGDPDHVFHDAARIGVMRAALTFDPAKSKFTTYTGWFIWGQVSSLIRQLLHPSETRTSFASSYEREESPDPWDHISGRVQHRPEDVGRARLEASEVLAPWLKHLRPKELLVITLRFGLDDGGARTLQVVAGELGLTRERIRQIEKAALLKLWKASGGRES